VEVLFCINRGTGKHGGAGKGRGTGIGRGTRYWQMVEVLTKAEVLAAKNGSNFAMVGLLAMTEVLATIPMMVLAPSGSDGCTGTDDGDSKGMGYGGSGDDGGISTNHGYRSIGNSG